MTPHNKAKLGEIAPSVLMPGDPDRAKYVADNFLENSRQVSLVRGIPCYTGTYKKKIVSVMASGMGGPSVGIYSWELFNVYNVENIIRIGTCGGFSPDLQVGDLVFVLTSSTDSAWAHQYNLKGTFSPVCSSSLLFKMVEAVEKLKYRYKCGMVLSSDLFSSYNALGDSSWKSWADMGAIAQDMESYALYSTAMKSHKNAFSILTMTDSLATNKSFADLERMSGNDKMILTALEGLL